MRVLVRQHASEWNLVLPEPPLLYLTYCVTADNQFNLSDLIFLSLKSNISVLGS